MTQEVIPFSKTFHDKMLEKALHILAQLQAEYIVKLGDRIEQAGTLQLQAPEPPKAKRTRKVIHYPNGPICNEFKETVDCMDKPGDEWLFKVPDGITVKSYRSAIGAYCSNHWGPKTYYTVISETDRTVRLVRYQAEP